MAHAAPILPPPVPRSRAFAEGSRPRFVDYFFMLIGVALSLLLVEWSGVRVEATAQLPRAAGSVVALLRYLLFLPQGIVLFWPLFFLSQKLAGREQGLAPGEWLWGLAWLISLGWVSWAAWRFFATPPRDAESFNAVVLTIYIVFVVATASIALVVEFVDLFGRWPQPWTHRLCLVLMIWPALPLTALWIWKLQVKVIAFPVVE